MGSGEVNHFPSPNEPKKEEPVDYAKIFDTLCPDYMAMGMTYDEYWNGDADMPRFYREAHRLRKEQANFDAWLHGLYTYHALAAVSPLFRDWVKDHKPENYTQPLDLYPKKKTVSQEQEAEDAKERANQEIIKQWVKRANRLYEEKHKEGAANG